MSGKKASKQKRGVVGVRIISAHTIKIPARPMVPTSAGLGPIWTKAFNRVITNVFKATLKAR